MKFFRVFFFPFILVPRMNLLWNENLGRRGEYRKRERSEYRTWWWWGNVNGKPESSPEELELCLGELEAVKEKLDIFVDRSFL